MSYDEYVTYSKDMTEVGCEWSSEWNFVEPVVKQESFALAGGKEVKPTLLMMVGFGIVGEHSSL